MFKRLVVFLALTLPALAQVSFTMGSAGVLTLTDATGRSIIDTPNAAPALVNVGFVDGGGNHTTGSVTVTGTTVVGNTVTRTYSWGSIATTFSVPSANKFQIVNAVTNSDPTLSIDYIWIQFVRVNFGTAPTSTAVTRAYGVEAPSIVYYDYTTGTVAMVNEDVTAPLMVGMAVGSGSTQFRFECGVAYGTQFSNNANAPTVIGPSSTKTFTQSARFGAPGATQTSLTSDIYTLFRTTYPSQVANFPNRPIASLHPTGNHPTAVWATNPRGWFNDNTVDVTTTPGKAAFQTRLLAWADTAVSVMLDVGANAGILWDMEGQQYTASYIGDPSLIETLAPELVGVTDAFIAKFTNAGLKVGFTLRPQTLTVQSGTVNVSSYSLTWVSGQTFSANWATNGGSVFINGLNYPVASVTDSTHLTLANLSPSNAGLPAPGNGSGTAFTWVVQVDSADPETVLRNKITYAKNRWGASNVTFFYIDTTHDANVPPTNIPGLVYQHLMQTWPTTLFMPENVDTKQMAYSFPYTDAGNAGVPIGGPTDPHVTYPYPTGRTIIKVSDPTTRISQITAAAASGNILMWDGWYSNTTGPVIKSIYQNLAVGSLTGLSFKGVQIQ